MTIQTYEKGPGEILDYGYDFTDILVAGESISTATVSANTGLTVNSSTDSDGIVTAWLSGGSPGETYSVKYTVVTNNSPARTYVRHIKVKINNR